MHAGSIDKSQMEAKTRIGIKAASVAPMNTSIPPFDNGSENSQEDGALMNERPLRICVVFDEAANARSAEVLIARVTPGFRCDRRAFRFDELSAPDRHKTAARNAADTDVLILAARGDRKLPSHIRYWLGLCFCLRDRDHEGALVALITKVQGVESLHSSIVKYLETIAIIGGMAFFPRVPNPRLALRPGANRLPARNRTT